MTEILRKKINLDRNTCNKIEGQCHVNIRQPSMRVFFTKSTDSNVISSGNILTALRRNQHCQHVDFGLLAYDNEFPLFKPPGLWYYVTAALAN